MQTVEELIREFPTRSRLLSLRGRVISDEPESELDTVLHQEFCRYSAEFVQVAASHTYQVPGQMDHIVKKTQWLWWRNDSIGWVDDAGTTHFWEGEQPGYWGDLMPAPRYTTRVEDALTLKWTMLGTDVHIRLDERVKSEKDDDGESFTRGFAASVLSEDHQCLSSAEHHVAAKAIIVAMINYLLETAAAV